MINGMEGQIKELKEEIKQLKEELSRAEDAAYPFRLYGSKEKDCNCDDPEEPSPQPEDQRGPPGSVGNPIPMDSPEESEQSRECLQCQKKLKRILEIVKRPDHLLKLPTFSPEYEEDLEECQWQWKLVQALRNQITEVGFVIDQEHFRVRDPFSELFYIQAKELERWLEEEEEEKRSGSSAQSGRRSRREANKNGEGEGSEDLDLKFFLDKVEKLEVHRARIEAQIFELESRIAQDLVEAEIREAQAKKDLVRGEGEGPEDLDLDRGEGEGPEDLDRGEGEDKLRSRREANEDGEGEGPEDLDLGRDPIFEFFVEVDKVVKKAVTAAVILPFSPLLAPIIDQFQQ